MFFMKAAVRPAELGTARVTKMVADWRKTVSRGSDIRSRPAWLLPEGSRRVVKPQGRSRQGVPSESGGSSVCWAR